MSTSMKKAYSEVDTFINLLGTTYIEKIPINLRNFFKTEKDNNYSVQIEPNIPIKDQSLKPETLSIIAFLNLKYWCKDENEIERLRTIYKNNENVYQEKFKNFNSDNIFKNKTKEYNETKIEEIVEYKPFSLCKKLINKIKSIFKINKL